MMVISDNWSAELRSNIGFEDWIEIPPVSALEDLDDWVARTAERVCRMIGIDPTSPGVLDVMSEIYYGVAERNDVDPIFSYQIWPINRPISLLCHGFLTQGEYVPEMSDGDGVLRIHSVESESLGQGRQYTTKLAVPDGDESLVTVEFVFTNHEASVVLAIAGSSPPLVGAVLPGFLALKDSLSVSDGAGSPFVGVDAENLDSVDDSWGVEAGI